MVDNELWEAFKLIENRLSGEPKYAKFVEQLQDILAKLIADSMTGKEVTE